MFTLKFYLEFGVAILAVSILIAMVLLVCFMIWEYLRNF